MQLVKLFYNRTTVLILAILVEVAAFAFLAYYFREEISFIESNIRLVSMLLIMQIVYKSKHLSFDVLWILGIVMFPITISILYFLVESDWLKSRTYRKLVGEQKTAGQYFIQDEDVLTEMKETAPDMKGQFHYIAKGEGFPFYRCEGFRYYGLGDEGYPQMLDDLRNAREFIFLEYFIVEEGTMWNGILDILEEKAAEGLEVRVMYDDLGSLGTLTLNYAKKLQAKGIKCIPFNRINPAVGPIMNHRDHRKIMVIDGKTAYSGGVNLADEYINARERFGHWKDNMIRMEGACVRSYTILFLSHWNALSGTENDYHPYIDTVQTRAESCDGYIAAYGETPLDDELTSQNIYMNILNQAQDYCYIMTPYLIIDNDMVNTLILAARRGVDVRIMTPGIPDKKMVWQITRSFYETLIEGGVKIYEYTPGFVHAKVFVSDDKVATVGTINLDYRSLYLHFENGTYIYGSEEVGRIRDDYLQAEEVSHQMTLEESRWNLAKKTLIGGLKVFAPLL